MSMQQTRFPDPPNSGPAQAFQPQIQDPKIEKRRTRNREAQRRHRGFAFLYIRCTGVEMRRAAPFTLNTLQTCVYSSSFFGVLDW